MLGLKPILILNATSCLVFGLVFVSLPSQTASFLAVTKPAASWIIVALGFVLLANAIHLWIVSRMRNPSHYMLFYFSAGDFLWVLATLVLLATGTFINTGAGIAASLVIAGFVGYCGSMQLIYAIKRQ